MKSIHLLWLLGTCIVCGQDPLVIAHRGGAGTAPENTLAAFIQAVEVGADYFELDVMISSDDSLMIIHDATVDRTTDGTGTVASMTYQQLRQLDAGSWFGPEFAGERIPTLRESLELAMDNDKDIGVVIEIKTSDESVPAAIVSMVREMEMEDRVIVSSFNLSQITRVRNLDPSIPIQLFGTIAESHIDQLAAINGEWVGTGGEITGSLIGYAHSQGVSFNAWTLNSAATMVPAIDSGVDGITTDYPALALTLMDQTEPSDVVLSSAIPEETRIALQWEAAADEESGIAGYDIFRGESPGATSLLVSVGKVTSYVDETYTESTSYFYRIKARNLAGLSSINYSNEIEVSTLNDITPPFLEAIRSRGDSTSVVVSFSERVNVISAADPANYTINNGVTVFAARLALDQQSVMLTTSPLDAGNYQLSVEHVSDRAHTPNPMDPASEAFLHMGVPGDAVAFYHLDSLYFSDPLFQVNDVSGNSNTGTAKNGVFLVKGILGNALGFDGADDHVSIPASASLNISGEALTLSLWTKLPARPTELSNSYAPLFDSETDNYVLYGDRGNSELRFKVSTSGGAERPGIPDADIPVNKWIHVAGVYDGSNAMVYLNGKLKDSHPLTGTVKTGQVATMGKTGSVYLEGAIDQVEVYHRALSQEELADIYHYYAGSDEAECPPVTAITEDGKALCVTSGDSFQWLDCDKGFAALSGKTDSIFSPQSNGHFAVVVTSGDCVDTSECVFVQVTGTMEQDASGPRIYPNPSQGNFSVDLTGHKGTHFRIMVVNSVGICLYDKKVSGGKEYRIDMSTQAPGIFLVRLMDSHGATAYPLLIQ